MGEPSVEDRNYWFVRWEQEKAKAAADLAAERNTMGAVLGSLCDALGCKHDNEAALEAIEASQATVRDLVAALRDAAGEFHDMAHSSGDPSDPANMEIAAVMYRVCTEAAAKAEAAQ